MNNYSLKILIVVATILYAVSPVDFMPGPIDDVIILLCGYIAQRKINA